MIPAILGVCITGIAGVILFFGEGEWSGFLLFFKTLALTIGFTIGAFVVIFFSEYMIKYETQFYAFLKKRKAASKREKEAPLLEAK